MADKEQPKLPTHLAYSAIRREEQDDYWLNIGVVFPHKDDCGFNIMLQAFPLDGRLFAERSLTMKMRKTTRSRTPSASVRSAGTADSLVGVETRVPLRVGLSL